MMTTTIRRLFLARMLEVGSLVVSLLAALFTYRSIVDGERYWNDVAKAEIRLAPITPEQKKSLDHVMLRLTFQEVQRINEAIEKSSFKARFRDNPYLYGLIGLSLCLAILSKVAAGIYEWKEKKLRAEGRKKTLIKGPLVISSNEPIVLHSRTNFVQRGSAIHAVGSVTIELRGPVSITS